MDPNRFDTLTRSLTAARSRRAAVGVAIGSALALLGVHPEQAQAHNPLNKCKKINDKQKRRACIKRAKKHNATHVIAAPAPSGTSGGCTPTTCAAQGTTCGSISDGCGGTLNCGPCTCASGCHPVCQTCNPATGQCDPVANGTACDDGDACTQADTCQEGVCTAGTAKVCPEQECQVGTCNTTGQCAYTNLPYGTACGTGGGCQNGQCVTCGCSCAPAFGVDCPEGCVCFNGTCFAASVPVDERDVTRPQEPACVSP